MKNSAVSRLRFDHQDLASATRSVGRRIVIENLDAAPERGAALLSICVVAATGTPASPIRFE